jgi:hypothetical protein
MKITKELKNGIFEYNEESKCFLITDSNNNTIELNKIYGFALMRFIIRIAQKNFAKSPLHSHAPRLSALVEEEEEEAYEDPRQEKFNF